MPPKKRKQSAALEPEVPSTVTTPRGKILNTTAAAARPKRNIASTMPPPDPPSVKKLRRADTSSASEVTPKKRGRPPKATTATPKSASTATPKSHRIGERQSVRLASTPASEEALPVLRRTRVAKSAKSAIPSNKSALPPIKRGRGRPPKASKKKQPVVPDDDAAEDANDDESGGVDYDDDSTHDANITEATTIIQADRNYWLMKAEPESRIEKNANGEDVDVKFTIDDLRYRTQPEPWEGIRNAQAQNNMKAMRVGDLAFLYESNCKKPGIVGIMEIVEEASPDYHAFDKNSAYYDPKSNPEKPKWMLVHVAFRRKFDEKFTLKDLQQFSQPGGALAGMELFRQSRLSVTKVARPQWEFIMSQIGDDDDDEEMQDFDVPVGAERDGEDMEAEAAGGGLDEGFDEGVDRGFEKGLDEGLEDGLDQDLDQDTGDIEGFSNTDLGNDFAAAFEAPANLRTATDESGPDPSANEIPDVVDQMSAYAMAPPSRDVSRDVSRGRSRRGRGRPTSVPVDYPEVMHDASVPAKHVGDAPSA
ncbi:DUF55-domain-containing protein [Aureobasidium subglaciale]|nr:DUF55-domain-containing protein [Aureobasidium subglaciale]